MTAIAKYATFQFCRDLVQMVAMKNGTAPGVAAGGGHDAFNLARAIDAFSAWTLRYKDIPNEDVWQSIKVGALLEVGLSGE